MSRHPLSLHMSQIIASDAPLLSPVSMSEAPWEAHQPLCSPTTETFQYSYYNLPPSPPNSIGSYSTDSPMPTSRMLKMRMSPDTASDSEQLCLPTHQLFDCPEVVHPPTPTSPSSPTSERDPTTIFIKDADNSAVLKRSASPAPSVGSKKARSVGERINSRDFIPPDVSGLSKREARLVKNRAAAFLSRQRKREEFECMEIRVAELEQENARLLAIAQSGNGHSISQSTPDDESASEIELLRSQLAAAKARELELSTELAAKAASPSPIKVESQEPPMPSAVSPRSTSVPSSHRSSAASLGLMVLLCALPTLLSMPTHSSTSTSFSLPSLQPAPSSTFDFNSFLPQDYDCSRPSSNMMDYDTDEIISANPTTSIIRKLEFSDSNPETLGGLDISFDASPSDNGKIRVRIHPSSSASSRATSPGIASFPSEKPETSSSSSLGMWAGTEFEPSFEASFSSSEFTSPPSSLSSAYSPCSSGDPFLGVGADTDFGMPYSSSSMMHGLGDFPSSLDYQSSDSGLAYGSEYSVGDSTAGGKRRVRIALKSMPASGGEGGEWEVQFC